MIKEIYIFGENVEINDPVDLFQCIEDGCYTNTLEEAREQVKELKEEFNFDYPIYKLTAEVVK